MNLEIKAPRQERLDGPTRMTLVDQSDRRRFRAYEEDSSADEGLPFFRRLGARREEDIDSGHVMLIDNQGIEQRIDGWQTISQRSHTTVKESSDGNTVVKLGPRGALVDQASALKNIHEEFGVTVPKALTLHKDGDQFLLFMEKVNYVEGQKMLMNPELEPLFWQASEVINDIRTYLNDKNSLYEGDLGNENWGIKPDAVERWRKTRQPISREDIIVIDPVRSIN